MLKERSYVVLSKRKEWLRYYIRLLSIFWNNRGKRLLLFYHFVSTFYLHFLHCFNHTVILLTSFYQNLLLLFLLCFFNTVYVDNQYDLVPYRINSHLTKESALQIQELNTLYIWYNACNVPVSYLDTALSSHSLSLISAVVYCTIHFYL